MRVVPCQPFNRIFCECGDELFSAEDMSKHRSRHTIEYWNATPERRRIMQMVEGDYRLHFPADAGVKAVGSTNDGEVKQ